MPVDEWDGDNYMSHQNWILAGRRVEEIDEEKKEAFAAGIG